MLFLVNLEPKLLKEKLDLLFNKNAYYDIFIYFKYAYSTFTIFLSINII